MRRLSALVVALAVAGVAADDNRPLGERTRQYLTDLVRLDTSNPPGNETRVADYLKQVADSHQISCELLGADPSRKNFVARIKGNGKGRPLLLIAHSDVVPADRKQWTVDPFSAELRNGFIYGRGTLDDKSLLAAELAVMVEIKRRNIKLGRDLILVSESDEEVGSTGIDWLTQHQFPKIDAEFALNQGGSIIETKDGPVFRIQTNEKISTRLVLTAKGTAGDASLPRPDNPSVHMSRAIVKLSDAEQPIKLNPTTRAYLRNLSGLSEYTWLDPILRSRKLDDPATQQAAAAQIRAKDPELDALLHTTVSVTTINGNGAEAQIDVRRTPSETREEILLRFKQIINDPAIEIALAPGQQMPSTEASPRTTALYRAMERAIDRMYPHDIVTPYMSRGATDGSYLRSRGITVYGVPIFVREPADARAHGNDERISPKNIEDGVELLWQIVLEAAGGGV
jgi:acetylornithine deacetylase/succinyl-diaminopimelate desuccinylase-like protein